MLLQMMYLLASHGILSVEVLPGETCAIPAQNDFPLHLDGYEASAFDEDGIVATRFAYLPPLANTWEAWSIGSDDSICFSAMDVSGIPVISLFQPVGSGGSQVLACASGSDTLWTCLLEGSDEFENGPVVSGSQNCGYLVSSRPDCNGTWTRIARITAGGEIVFSTLITSVYLLDSPEPVGEIGPSVESLGMTADGDVIVAGRVSQWFTSPEEWFVCLLDGLTGAPLWKATGSAKGLAGLNQVTETPSGAYIGVGSTSVPGDPGLPWVWGEEEPLLVVIASDGTVLDECTFRLETVDALTGIAALDAPGACLAAGRDGSTGGTVLARLMMTGME